MTKPRTRGPWVAIARAGLAGRGIRLSADEVSRLVRQDDATMTAAQSCETECTCDLLPEVDREEYEALCTFCNLAQDRGVCTSCNTAIGWTTFAGMRVYREEADLPGRRVYEMTCRCGVAWRDENGKVLA